MQVKQHAAQVNVPMVWVGATRQQHRERHLGFRMWRAVAE